MRWAVVKWLLKAYAKEQNPMVRAMLVYQVLREAGLD